jgi:hypothetical protein
MWRLAHRDARASANSDAEVAVAPVMQLCHVNVWPRARLGSVLELPDCTRSKLFLG